MRYENKMKNSYQGESISNFANFSNHVNQHTTLNIVLCHYNFFIIENLKTICASLHTYTYVYVKTSSSTLFLRIK